MSEIDFKMVGCRSTISSVNDFMVDVTNFAAKNDVGIQLLNANMIFGKEHIISAFEHAKRSLQRNEASTHSMEMELLLYASGERQIKHAIKKMGIQKGELDFIAIFLFDKEKRKKIDNIIDNFLQFFHLRKNDSVFNPDDSKLVHFGISKQAIQSVQKDQIFQLVLEKIALVDIIK